MCKCKTVRIHVLFILATSIFITPIQHPYRSINQSINQPTINQKRCQLPDSILLPPVRCFCSLSICCIHIYIYTYRRTNSKCIPRGVRQSLTNAHAASFHPPPTPEIRELWGVQHKYSRLCITVTIVYPKFCLQFKLQSQNFARYSKNENKNENKSKKR